ncbi:aldehyde dehydrogenase family protein [Rhodococcus sp. IEGM 1366]|uniref:aldehyde dehydrogenase family protein n=1 Tax=Rhodococcus sp. IEGM 1366 TaxID=3082223 RepID=UPI00295379D3|nr:aldehyde dehydrogenase family protein [Rhodococcus sp. IEGM 1366]MDV8070709.1 aldehyde dehydrogenase family protein [Rhodococcus sp. IEGM 1366]
MTWMRDTVLIDGRWQRCPAVTAVENPATGEVVGQAAAATVADVDDGVRAAYAAGVNWGRTTGEQRGKALGELAEALRTRRDELVAATVAEVGAPIAVAEESHVDLAIEIIESFAAIARDTPLIERVGNSVLLRRPAGVVACITPWNYPLYQLAAKVGAALAAGCTTVLKPAELTPITTYLFCDAVLETSLPAGVVNLVPGSGSVVGPALTEHPDVAVVSFTGSTVVGRQVGRTAGELIKRACLELGGKSASVILEDADIAAAVFATVDSAMLNSGQTCSAWTRMLVPRSRYGEAVQLAATRANALVVGDPTDRGTDLGPVVSLKQRLSILAAVNGAVDRGATIVAGGPDPLPGLVGHFVRPTVLCGVERGDPVTTEEIFGPVLVVEAYEDVEDAIALANGTDYGLAGAVWSGDVDRALDVAGRLETGQVDINGAKFNPLAPFGGWKLSGLGRELGTVGIEEFTEWTAVQL